MTVNYDGRWELELLYDVVIDGRTLSHRQTYDIHMDAEPEIGDDFAFIGLLTKSNGDKTLKDWVDDYVLEMVKAPLGTGTSDVLCNLWRYNDEPSIIKVWYSSYNPATPAWAGTSQAAEGAIYTFRTLGGGECRIYFMEIATSFKGRLTRAGLSGDQQDLTDFLCNDDSVVLGRDNEHLSTLIAGNFATNKKLEKKRFRST